MTLWFILAWYGAGLIGALMCRYFGSPPPKPLTIGSLVAGSAWALTGPLALFFGLIIWGEALVGAAPHRPDSIWNRPIFRAKDYSL
jgi:hypothetical protein